MGPHFVDELFIELALDIENHHIKYLLNKYRQIEEDRVTGFYIQGFNTGASEQREFPNERQKMETVKYKQFTDYRFEL
jgi:hypothetical protein